MTCNDLLLGGTLSASGISGGTSINSTALHVYDWAGLFGTPGITGSMLNVNGRPGGFLAGDQLGRQRFFNLNIEATKMGPNITLTEPTADEQLKANTDDFLDLIQEPETYLEVVMPDGSKRYLVVTNLDAGYTNFSLKKRRWSIPLVSDWPYWRRSVAEEDTISGADTIGVTGKKTIYDAVLVFSGDGTFTHSDEGWAIEVTGSGGAVTVDLGARTVTEGGNPALNRIRRTVVEGMGRIWGWFPTGTNNVTSDVSVDITFRPQFP